MKTAHISFTTPLISAAAIGMLVLGLSGNSLSAPGSLATSPLFLQTVVQPNIFFMIDDSGSMDWADLLNTGTYSPGDAILSDSLLYNPPGAYTAEWNRRLARLFCRGFNVMAYDPTVHYTPWQGVDSAGNPYGNMSLTSARSDPYVPTSTVDISGHYYWPWNDADGDGEYDGPDDPALWGGDPASGADECGNVATLAGGVAVNSLPATGTVTNPNSQQNYANWYSYYRKRELVMKRAMSSILAKSTARAGLATLWNNNNVRTLVRDVDDITLPVDLTARANKQALLRNLFRINSTGGTPLRQALQNAGNYYEGTSAWGASPILPAGQGGECQKNFTILMSDGFWNGNAPAVGDTDSDNNTVYDGGAYADGDTASIISNTLADVAMHYYERDLAPSLQNKVRPVPGVDENRMQHMVTYTVAFGVKGTPGLGSPQPGDTAFPWPTPVANSPTSIDDMHHAAFNGRGQFLSAGDPQRLVDSLNQYIADIQARNGTAAAVTFNSTSLQAGTRVFQARFNSERWSGDLSAIDIGIDPTTGIATVGGVAWNAATGLDNRTQPRQFVTFDGNNGVKISDNGDNNIDSAWNRLTIAQKNDLRTNSSGTLDNEATGKARLDYLRGNRNCEISNTAGTCNYTDAGGNTFNSRIFRDRDSALSDIVHSSPFFVGDPSTPYPNNIEPVPYSSFAISKAGRLGMTYVGANDGMLHAFDENGTEVFSYIPKLLFSTQADAGLHYLSDPAYTHRYYVDLSPIVQDAYVNVGGTTAWRSILVGALRGGGKGLFAIDVTDPAALATNAGNKVMWEFGQGDPGFDDLGYTFSDIRIGKMNNGKWAAIFGNGYNNDPLGDGEAKLFILYLDGSAPDVIDTGAGSIQNADCSDPASDCNGLSTPTIVDLNGDGTVDRIYAGDLHGNLWAFNVAGSSPISWQSAYGSSPLFKACTAAPCTLSNRQPITAKPSVARHLTERSLATEPNLMVFVGTGQYMAINDNTNSLQQTFYGVWDSGTGNINRSALVSQSITQSFDATFGNIRTITDNPVPYSSKKGWLIDLPVTRERAVTNPLALGKIVFFNTMIPSTNICDSGGSGWLMAVSQLTGGVPSFPPVDLNNDGVFNLDDTLNGTVVVGSESTALPTESRFISNKRVTADSGGGIQIDSVQPTEGKSPARMSWTSLDY